MKSKERVLYDLICSKVTEPSLLETFEEFEDSIKIDSDNKMLFEAMSAYSDEQNAALLEEVDRLRTALYSISKEDSSGTFAIHNMRYIATKALNKTT